MSILDLVKEEFPSATKEKDYRGYKFYHVNDEHFSIRIWETIQNTFLMELKLLNGLQKKIKNVTKDSLIEELQSMKGFIKEFCLGLLEKIGEPGEDS